MSAGGLLSNQQEFVYLIEHGVFTQQSLDGILSQLAIQVLQRCVYAITV